MYRWTFQRTLEAWDGVARDGPLITVRPALHMTNESARLHMKLPLRLGSGVYQAAATRVERSLRLTFARYKRRPENDFVE
jgi:hypothetical protein